MCFVIFTSIFEFKFLIMNSKVIFFLFFLFGSFNSSFLMAQYSLSFGSSGVQHEDTLSIGDSVHFSFWLVNEGNVAINDSVEVLCETFDIIGTSISSMAIESKTHSGMP